MAKQETVKIAVFDINGTLYQKSSKEKFFKYVCFRKDYKLFDIFNLVLFKLLGKARLIDQTQFKENFFNYLDDIPPETVDRYAREFWGVEFPRYFSKRLLQRVEELKSEGIQIFCISGALEVYLKPLFEYLEVDAYYGTEAVYKNGTYLLKGKACKDEVKVQRLDKHFGDQPYCIVEAYSDEAEMILDKAEKGYLVDPDGTIEPYTP